MAKKSFKWKVSESTYKVELVKNIFIPMQDGVHLAADLYRPDAKGKFPAVVIYLPYRKDDQSREYAEHQLGYFAKRGYVGLFVDVRGTGSSEGRYLQHFDTPEQRDGREAIEWIADQPWCDGNVGMTSSSYGGATSYLVAQRNPPHLKAIAPGLYGNAQDGSGFFGLAYPGGSPTCYWFFGLSLNQLDARSCSPTTYQDNEGRWMRIWKEQIENPPRAIEMFQNQKVNKFWKEKSIVPEKIRVPVFHWDGWRDYFYPKWALETFIKLKVPKKMLMGPWPHLSPDSSKPGPTVDFLYEILRWFEYWLKGIDTGVLDEPPITIYVERYVPPSVELDHVAGEWRYEDEWPPKGAVDTPFYLHPGGQLSKDFLPLGKVEVVDSYRYNPVVGMAAGLRLTGFSIGSPTDQRPDELHSLVYTTDPLEKEIEIAGMPDAILYVSSTADVAMFVAKLCDVAPDGVSSMVARGLLNATRRNSFERPEALQPGRVYEIKIPLTPLSHIFEKDHRIRLGIASSDFPLIWPTPKNCTNSVYHSRTYPSRMMLPIVARSGYYRKKPRLKAPKPQGESEGYPITKYEVKRDFLASKVTLSVGIDSTYANGRMGVSSTCNATASELNPEDVRVEATSTVVVKGPSTVSEVVAKTYIQSTADAFHLHISHDGKLNETPYFTRTWSLSTPRVLL